MRLGQDWIAARIPHRGRMCLLDEVLELDPVHIRCRAVSHRDPDNPLRAHGRLGAVCGIEYAAQAMALHAGCPAGEPTRPASLAGGVHGLIASVRRVALEVSRLDDLPGDLIAAAVHVHGDAHSALYDFTLTSEGRLLASGRAAVVLTRDTHAA